MRRLVLLAIIVIIAAMPAQTRATLENNRPPAPQPILLGGKIYIYPGAHVVLRNVDMSRLPQITVRADGVVTIDGSADPGAPIAQW